MRELPRRMVTWVLIWALTLVGLRLTLLAPEVCPPINIDSAHAAAVGAADWIVLNQNPDGKYLYEWDRDADSATDAAYNMVRHAGTTMALYQFAAAGEIAYLDAADAGMDWMLQQEVGNDTVAAIAPTPNSNAKLGTVALATAGLVHRRRATGDTSFDDLLRRFGNLMVGQQRADGSMLDLWSPTEEAPVPGLTSLFSTGEATWALALLDSIWPDENWGERAFQTLDYIATVRDEEENVWPRPWADQWAAYALNELSGSGLTDAHLDYAGRLAAQWGVAVRWDSQRNGGIDELVHAPESIAAGQGTWLEGLGMLGLVAGADGRLTEIQADVNDRLLCTAGRMVDKQTVGTGRDELDGAFFVNGVARVDGQQHVLSGLILAEALLRERELEAQQ
ncbi:MAG: hypothetical protein ACC660_06965 [Acidimicrobiales bacterium]